MHDSSNVMVLSSDGTFIEHFVETDRAPPLLSGFTSSMTHPNYDRILMKTPPHPRFPVLLWLVHQQPWLWSLDNLSFISQLYHKRAPSSLL